MADVSLRRVAVGLLQIADETLIFIKNILKNFYFAISL